MFYRWFLCTFSAKQNLLRSMESTLPNTEVKPEETASEAVKTDTKLASTDEADVKTRMNGEVQEVSDSLPPPLPASPPPELTPPIKKVKKKKKGNKKLRKSQEQLAQETQSNQSVDSDVTSSSNVAREPTEHTDTTVTADTNDVNGDVSADATQQVAAVQEEPVADVTEHQVESSQTAEWFDAVAGGDRDVMKMLLESGVSVNATDEVCKKVHLNFEISFYNDAWFGCV